jgi:osmoprotectant transport system permease protein
MPLLLAGLRTAAVQVVATATLAAVTAWGGLGRFIVDGFGQQDNAQIVAGAILVGLLALVTELGLAWLQRAVVSDGLRPEQVRRQRTAAVVTA